MYAFKSLSGLTVRYFLILSPCLDFHSGLYNFSCTLNITLKQRDKSTCKDLHLTSSQSEIHVFLFLCYFTNTLDSKKNIIRLAL